MIKSGRSSMVESTGRYTGTTVVRSTAEKVLKNHGKNNSTGKFDAYVNKMHGLYKATLLDPDELEKVMEKEYQKMYESADPMNESQKYVTLYGAPMNRYSSPTPELRLQASSSGRTIIEGSQFSHKKYLNAIPKLFGSQVDYQEKDYYEVAAPIDQVVGKILAKFSQLTDNIKDARKLLNEATGSDLYYVSGKTGDPTLSTSDPAKAVEHWFKICRGAKMMASIHTLKEKDGVNLLKWASQNHDKINAWHKKYNCPYQLDYILHGVDHAATSGRIYGFYEDPRATDAFEGDMISVFSAG